MSNLLKAKENKESCTVHELHYNNAFKILTYSNQNFKLENSLDAGYYKYKYQVIQGIIQGGYN